jgi:DNA-binding CsgD family transcriptional regulator
MPHHHIERHLPAGTTWESLNAASNGGLLERTRILRRDHKLTTMEAKCVALLEQGYNNGEIAEIFGILPSTVDNHTPDIRHKLKIPIDVKLSVAFLPKTPNQP